MRGKRNIWLKLIAAVIVIMSFTQKPSAQQLKTIGYLPNYRFSVADQIDFKKLTHVNLSFANPDAQGNLSFDGSQIDPIIEMIHGDGAQVYISLAGGALTSAWASAWEELTKPNNRDAFITKIISYTQNHDFDGIDMDLEWNHVDENYSGFVLALREAINQTNLGFTVALPGTYRYPEITDEALAAYDWLNMMVYDLTGPWAPNNPGPHSPYSFAINAISYWKNHGMSADKLTLGVPFYGYDFTDNSNVFGRTYAGIVQMNSNNAYVDQIGQIYYNGIPTIEQKAMLAKEELSGIMIWELGQDNFGDFSLLDVIADVMQTQVSTSDLMDRSITVFPNPFDDQINIQMTEYFTGEISLLDMNGRLLNTQIVEQNREINLDTDVLVSGMYLLRLASGNSVRSMKVVKQ